MRAIVEEVALLLSLSRHSDLLDCHWTGSFISRADGIEVAGPKGLRPCAPNARPDT